MTACSRLQAATLELVKNLPYKQRLASAYSNHLKELDPVELPTELRARFEALAADLEAVQPLRGENAVQATVRKMSAEQAEHCARRIVELAYDCAYTPSTVTRLPVRDKRDETFPLLVAAEG